ncbi:hypothetical protein [Streptomyces sp. R35]|uniref:Uncharacterized protein n=1 Tax=Streptomyces sp. R35 TaxID=3238630 RepID=A0AB39RXN8_9ACTN
MTDRPEEQETPARSMPRTTPAEQLRITLSAGAETEDLAAFILDALDDDRLDEIDVERSFGPAAGVAFEPVTISLVLATGLATTVVMIGRSVERWLETRRQEQQLKYLLDGFDRHPDLAAMVRDVIMKHADVAAEYQLPNPPQSTVE